MADSSVQYVNILELKVNSNHELHQFQMCKKVGEILDELIPDSELRNVSGLIFLGNRLPEEMFLNEVKDLKAGYTVHLVISSFPEKKAELNLRKLKACRNELAQLAVWSWSDVRVASMQVYNKSNLQEIIINKFPSIRTDPVALIIATDLVLTLCYFSNEINDDFFIEHPLLVDAVHYILFFLFINESLKIDSSAVSFVDTFPVSSDAFQEESTYYDLLRSYGYVMNTSGHQVTWNLPNIFREAQQIIDAAELYADQNQMLVDFGFTDTERNLRILSQTNGNVEEALEIIVNEIQGE